MTELAVIFDELPTPDGGRIGIARLNSPKSLNALSLEMARQLDAKLQAWAVDRSVVAVWLEGVGDRAFCAGGDVVALYRSIVEEEERRTAAGETRFDETYFTIEYQLDYRIHTYPKPILVWGKDRKSTRLNSSHVANTNAVFCMKKKNITAKTH